MGDVKILNKIYIIKLVRVKDTINTDIGKINIKKIKLRLII